MLDDSWRRYDSRSFEDSIFVVSRSPYDSRRCISFVSSTGRMSSFLIVVWTFVKYNRSFSLAHDGFFFRFVSMYLYSHDTTLLTMMRIIINGVRVRDSREIAEKRCISALAKNNRNNSRESIIYGRGFTWRLYSQWILIFLMYCIVKKNIYIDI